MNKTLRFSVFVALSIAASALNYITYPILARLLPSSQFVEITIALSLLTQVSAFLSALVALSVGLTKDGEKAGSPTTHTLQAVILRLFLVIVFFFCLSAPFTMPLLGVNALYAVPVAIMLLFSIPTSVISGHYNGKGLLVILGLVAFITASAQFVICVTVAAITKNGLSALIAMGIGQMLSLALIYLIFRRDNLPRLSVSEKIVANKKLVRFAAASALGIMAINILQVADLLIASTNGVETSTYTSLYVVSRIVFFGGMILLWPFLSWINTTDDPSNIGAVARVSSILIGVSLGAMAGMYIVGQPVLEILFGTTFTLQTVTTVGVLSILYRLLYLLIIMFVLYFTVMRSYWAAVIPSYVTAATLVYARLLPQGSDLYTLLFGLCIIGISGVAVCVGAYSLSYTKKLTLRTALGET